MLTCPGWAVWGGTSRGRGTHGTFQSHKGALLPGCTAKQTGPFRTSGSGATGLPPPATTTNISHSVTSLSRLVDMEAWFQQVQIYLAVQIKLCNTDMNLHEKHWRFCVLKTKHLIHKCSKSNDIKVNQITQGYFVLRYREQYLFLLEKV